MRLLIAQVDRPSFSDTFIQAHAARLSPDVAVTWGVLGNLLGEARAPRAALSLGRALASFVRRERAPNGWERRTTDLSYRSVLRRVRPAIVLAEYGPIGARIMDACRREDVPFVVHFHGFDASRRDVLAHYAAEYRAMFRAAYAVIGVSHDMVERLAALGAPREKLIYNPYGVDIERFGGGQPARARPTFLAVGRFVAKKAPHLTVRAFAAVHAERAHARLKMIGAGPLLESSRQLAERLGIEHAVDFLGPQSHDVVSAEMSAARAFVQHSVEAPSGDREGTPVAVLEASATGIPVVATRHAGIPDVIIDGETGYLVDEGDVRRMAQRMLQLVDHPEHAASLGRAGRERIAEHFTMQRSITVLREVLQAGARGHTPRPRRPRGKAPA